jgi:hypothetical protein
MSRYAFVVFLLLGGLEASAQEPAGGCSDPAGTSTSEPAPDGRAPQVAAGYMVTPSGMVIFPEAPPPTGDNSTPSGAGPSVSSGPVVGPGPEVSTGPVVGTGP